MNLKALLFLHIIRIFIEESAACLKDKESQLPVQKSQEWGVNSETGWGLP